MMGMMLCQNMELRQTLVQKLGLESEYLETCLVRSEELLKQRKYQRGITLVRHLTDEDQYHSVMDFLVGLFVPSMKPEIFGYYHGRNGRLIDDRAWGIIDLIDRKMVLALEHLSKLADAMWHAKLTDKTLRLEVTAAEVDLVLRPMFPVVQPLAAAMAA